MEFSCALRHTCEIAEIGELNLKNSRNVGKADILMYVLMLQHPSQPTVQRKRLSLLQRQADWKPVAADTRLSYPFASLLTAVKLLIPCLHLMACWRRRDVIYTSVAEELMMAITRLLLMCD